jgi:PKD repeat protein
VINFTSTSTGTGTVTYNWDFGDGNTSMLENPTHTYTNNGNYVVTLSITDTCGTVMSAPQSVNINITGVKDLSGSMLKPVYTVKDNVLHVSLPSTNNATVKIYNVVGETVFAETGIHSASKSISLNDLSAGTYLLQVSTSLGNGTAKFVVIK